MFESLERGSRLDTLMRFLSFLVSLVFHFVALGTAVILPLLFLNVVPEEELVTFLIAPPPPPISPPPPPPPVDRNWLRRNIVSKAEITYPPRIPDGIPPPNDEPPPVVAPILSIASALEGNRIGPGSDLMDLLRTSPPPPPPPPLSKPEWSRAAIMVGGSVQASKLVVRVDPVYPETARVAHVSGAVILQVTVDEEGAVSEVEVLSGHPLLNEAAVRAVKQWRYSPTLLNGEPVPVMATVTVIFRLR